MSVSLPSAKVTILDVPEVKDFRAKFVYSFFTKDESLNDTQNVPNDVKRVPAESFDAQRIENIRRIVPRFVRFDFLPAVAPAGLTTGNEFISHAEVNNKLQIAQNIKQIQSEEEFSNSDYTGFEFQDTNLDVKLFTLVSGSIAKRITAKNRSIQQKIDENRQTVINGLQSEHSLLDAARALADDTSPSVSNNVIVNAMNQIDALKLKFTDDSLQEDIIDKTFDRVKNVTVKGQFSNKLVGQIVKNIVNDPMSPFADEFAGLQVKAKSEQIKTLARVNPRVIFVNEIEPPTFKALRKVTVDAHDAPSVSKIIGYIIEKKELTLDGKLKEFPPIIIENASTTTAVDMNVAYGRTYVYTIRTVAQVSIRASHDDIDDIVLATGLVKSRRSTRVFVSCTESISPPSIADINVVWDYSVNAPVLLWNFPVNPQRDIKRFQIFRRASINEPFQLIKELDFDDSDFRINGNETPAIELIEKLNEPVTSYIDTEFTKDSRFIYSICSIDAHGLSSNYSTQLEISFDRFKNRIKKRLISNSGAPKSYPNMSLLQDTFSDTMKVSGHTRARVIFDPEFLEVFDSKGNDLGLVVTDRAAGDGKYRLQIINTDVQKQEIINIRIQDRRNKRS